jgi:cyanophycinase
MARSVGIANETDLGTFAVIGGAEDKNGEEGDGGILERLASMVGNDRLVVLTCATEDPAGSWQRYRRAFTKLGLKKLSHIDVRDREQALEDERSKIIEDSGAVFFTGGDQLRITAHIGDTPVYQRIRDLVRRGGIAAGTSAGAAVMSETMLIGGESDNTPHVGDIVKMAPGFGFLRGYIVDIHFSERGRIGRLVGAVAQNPAILGVGIDENTALFVKAGCGEVVGDGAVWFVDGMKARGSNVGEASGHETLSIENVRLNVLNAGRQYDLINRRPVPLIEERAA